MFPSLRACHLGSQRTVIPKYTNDKSNEPVTNQNPYESASIFFANSKSNALIPPASCVARSTVTRL